MSEVQVNCPNCGQPLVVHEEPHNYAILNGDEAVHACPMCAVDLVYGDDGLAIPGETLPE